MELQTQLNKLLARLSLVEDRFITFQSAIPSRLDHSHWMFLEGLASATWQYWGAFCRSIVIDSALGSRTANGINLTPCAESWEEVSYIASCIAKARRPVPNGTNSDLRREPTWGDPTKLILIVNALNLGNKDTLASALGADSYVPHLQIVRNAAAHRHYQNTASVLTLRPYYQVSRLRHPSEALLWLEEHTKSFAFLFWLEDMRMLGNLAVQ